MIKLVIVLTNEEYSEKTIEEFHELAKEIKDEELMDLRKSKEDFLKQAKSEQLEVYEKGMHIILVPKEENVKGFEKYGYYIYIARVMEGEFDEN